MFSPESAREFFGRVEDPLALLETLFLHAPIGVQLYSPRGQSLFVNRAFMDIFGSAPPPEYSVLRDELAGETGVAQVIHDAFAGKPGKIPAVWYDPRQLKHVEIKEGKGAAIETSLMPILGPGGEVRHVIFFFRDVTAQGELERQRSEVESRLKDANLLLNNLLNGSKAVIYAKGLDGRFLFANRQYGEVTGLEPAAILGKLQHEVHPPEIAALMRENDLRVIESKTHLEFEESVTHPDGSQRDYISLKFPLFDPDGTIRGIGGISTDLTDVRRLEKELGQARRMESLGLLAGGIAHDFNNLLGMILLHVDSVARQFPGAPPELRLDFEHIRGAIERASSLVRQLLAFGRRLPLSPRTIDLNAVVRDLSFLAQRLAGDGIDLVIELHPEACVVKADPVRLEQVLLNLCMNSRDALEGKGRIRIRSGRETLRTGDSELRMPIVPGPYVFFEIEDDGPGMEPAVFERAFEPFFTTKEPGSGSGLGLATVFGIAQESQGNIRLVTAAGAGCRIRVYLPEAVGAALSPLPQTAAGESPPESPRSRGTALLVEDEPLLRDITARHLRGQGFTVLEARRPDEVAPLLRANPGVSLLMTDVIMPKQSGPAMVQELRRIGLLDGVAVLFVSGYSSDELSRYGIQGGTLLEKPFSLERLHDAVEQALAAVRPKP